MSTNFTRIIPTTVEDGFCIVQSDMRVKLPEVDLASDPKIRQRLRDYVSYWIQKNLGQISAAEMERRAKKLGLHKGVSDATITNILAGKDFKMGLPTIRNLALLLGRPPEELFLVAIGREAPNGDGIQSQLTSIAETFPTLSKEQQKFFRMQLDFMIRQMNSQD